MALLWGCGWETSSVIIAVILPIPSVWNADSPDSNVSCTREIEKPTCVKVSDFAVCHLTSLVSRVCTEAMSFPISSLFTCPSLFSAGIGNGSDSVNLDRKSEDYTSHLLIHDSTRSAFQVN